MHLGITTIFAICVGVVCSARYSYVEWDGLIVTFGIFNHLPRTVYQAEYLGYEKISSCDLKAAWRGERYVKDDDRTLILLFDVRGFIAGVQTSIPKTGGFPSKNLLPPFIADGKEYVLTVYLQAPTNICVTGRSLKNFNRKGTGSNLYIQNTPNPEESLQVPNRESKIRVATPWTLGECMLQMGRHYWYDVKEDTKCDSIFPVFVLYNTGRLSGFGFAFPINLKSDHYEHPTTAALPGIFRTSLPKCLETLSTLHVYLTDAATKNRC